MFTTVGRRMILTLGFISCSVLRIGDSLRTRGRLSVGIGRDDYVLVRDGSIPCLACVCVVGCDYVAL